VSDVREFLNDLRRRVTTNSQECAEDWRQSCRKYTTPWTRWRSVNNTQ